MSDILPQDDAPRKQCTNPDCQQWYPATTEFFYANNHNKDDLFGPCKACTRAYRKARYQILGSQPRYQTPAAHDRALAYANARYRIPEVRERMKARERRPDVKARRAPRGRTRRARKRAVAGTHTYKQIQDLLKRQKYKCYYCTGKFERRNGKYVYHVDHTFPLSRVAGTDIPANDINYLVLACPACNMSKGKKFPWEFPEGGRLL